MWFVPLKTIWGEILTHSKGKEPLWNRWAGRVFTLTLFIFKAADFFLLFFAGGEHILPMPKKKKSCKLLCPCLLPGCASLGGLWHPVSLDCAAAAALHFCICTSASAPLHLHLLLSSPCAAPGSPFQPRRGSPSSTGAVQSKGRSRGKVGILFIWLVF